MLRALSVAALLLMAPAVHAQPVDWWVDAPLFATTSDETHPLLISAPAGRTAIAICRSAPGGAGLRSTSSAGSLWRAVSWGSDPDSLFAVCRDDSQLYVCGLGHDGRIDWYRFAPTDSTWPQGVHDSLGPHSARTPAAVAMYCDAEYREWPANVNTVWFEYQSSPAVGHLRFARGQSGIPPNTFVRDIAPPLSGAASSSGVALGASWRDESERLLVAAAIDRPGTAGPSLRLYASDNLGADWSGERVLDSAGVVADPALCAWQQNVLLCYTRRESADSRARLYYTYSPDAGETFAPLDSFPFSFEHVVAPRLAIAADHERFMLAFIAGDPDSTTGSVYVLRGTLAEPWAGGELEQVSATNSARYDGGLSLTTNDLGAAVAWTSPWQAGDNDVRWDASWRTQRVIPRPLAASAQLVSCFPNPFNGSTSLVLTLDRPYRVDVTVHNELGQRVRAYALGPLSAGLHLRELSFAGLASGRYYVSTTAGAAPLRVTLLK